MNWKLDTSPAPARQVKGGQKSEEGKRLSLILSTLNHQLQLLTEEAQWWQGRSGTKAELTRQVIAESIKYSKQEIDTLHTIHNMPEG